MLKNIQMLISMSGQNVLVSAHNASIMRYDVWILPIKKTLRHPRADEDARRDFQEKIEAYKAAEKPIIYIYESDFANDMPRIHGYAPRKGEDVLEIKIGTPEAEPMS